MGRRGELVPVGGGPEARFLSFRPARPAFVAQVSNYTEA